MFYHKRITKEHGFTLAELLVSMAVTSALSVISFQAFDEYKKRTFNTQSISNMREGVTAQESYFIVNEEYVECDSVESCEIVLPGFAGNEDVCIEYVVDNPTEGLNSTAYHIRGNKTYSYSRAAGGITYSLGVNSDCNDHVQTSTTTTPISSSTSTSTSSTTSSTVGSSTSSSITSSSSTTTLTTASSSISSTTTQNGNNGNGNGNGNNGHGNNLDGTDSSNPGQGNGGPNGGDDPSGDVDDEAGNGNGNGNNGNGNNGNGNGN